MDVRLDEPLPFCDGPKLQPFEYRYAPVNFIRLLNAGDHGSVFEVLIESNKYALKIFNFYDPREAIGLAGLNIPQELVVAHIDPFYAECRAYGRIEANGCNGTVAVRCHGFISISLKQEEELGKKFGIVGWDRPEEDDELAYSTDTPLRAIVKELVSDDVPFTQKKIKRMKNDLFTLRRMGIFVRDIRADNYRGGRLVDFSISWTDPHIMMNERYWKRKTIDRDRDWELRLFDKMIDESGVPNPRSIFATSNPKCISKLRPRKPKVDPSRSYELERILDKRFKSRVAQYLVRWKDYGPEGDQWKDESELQDAKELVQDYESTAARTAKKRNTIASVGRQHARALPTPTPSSNPRSRTAVKRRRGRPLKNQKNVGR